MDWLSCDDPERLLRHLVYEEPAVPEHWEPRARPLVSHAQLWHMVTAWYWGDAAVADGMPGGPRTGYGGVLRRCARAAEEAALAGGPPPGGRLPLYPLPGDGDKSPFTIWWADQAAGDLRHATRRTARAAAVRAVAGNPFRPCPLPPECRTPLTRRLAQAAFDERSGHGVCPACRGKGRWLKAGGPREGHVTGVCRTCQGAGTVSAGTLDPERLAILCDALLDAGLPETVPADVAVGVRVANTPRVGCDLEWAVAAAAEIVHRGRTASAALTWAEVNLGVASWRICPEERVYRGDGRRTAPATHPILAHLRGPVPRYRGDWAVACILD